MRIGIPHRQKLEVIPERTNHEEWRLKLARLIEKADAALAKGQLEDIQSAIMRYQNIQNVLAEKTKKLRNKCHTLRLEEERTKIEKKIEGIQENLFRSLNQYSFKVEKHLSQIDTICTSYQYCGQGEVSELVARIQRQAGFSLARLEYLTQPIGWCQAIYSDWDRIFIVATKGRCRPDFFAGEYACLFRDHIDLREAVIQLTDKGFVRFMGKMQGYLVKYLKKKFSLKNVLQGKPLEWEFRKHKSVTYEQIKQWLSEANSDEWIQDLPDMLKEERLLQTLEATING